MVTAKELLSSVETENHIVIGNDRFIVVPAALKRIAVQYDHNIETVTFDCPRFWDDHDMSKMAVYINYMLSNGYRDSYPAKNVVADGDIMHFDWTISANVTQIPGVVSFLVCVKNVDAEGNEENHWNSELCQDMHVSKGLECEENALEMEPDLVTELLLRMNSVEQINIQATEMQAIYDATVEVANDVEEIKNQALDASGHIKNSYANAIKDIACGEIVQVNDVSPIQHTPTVKIHGKNMLIYPYDELTSVRDGVTFTVLADQGISVVGTPTVNTSFNLAMQYKKKIPIQKGKTYTLSCTSTLTGERGYVYVQNWAYGASVDATTLRQEPVQFTATVDGYLQLGIVLLKGQVFDEVMYIQIEEGSVATEYERYIDPSTMTVVAYGKNHIRHPFAEGTVTRAGVTFTDRGDGTVNADGTSSGAYMNIITTESKQLYLHAGVTYHLSGVPKKTGLYYMYAKDASGTNYFDYGEGCTFIPSVSGYGAVTIVVTTESKVSNVVFKPQLEIGTATSGFQLGSSAKYIPASDGSVTIASTHPTLTLMSDTPGAIIDLKYLVDTETRFLDLVTSDRIQTAVDVWLTAHYTEAEGVSF